ncbi:MAG: hypothetical protein EBZ59_05500 [Planctomycetia bacterium]|nr:hypothetical protein [Planctomycetia bacterium]
MTARSWRRPANGTPARRPNGSIWRPSICASITSRARGQAPAWWPRSSRPPTAGSRAAGELEPHAGAEQARTAALARPAEDTAAIAVARAEAAARIAAVRSSTFATVTPRDFLTEPAERIRHTGRGLGQDWGSVIHRLLELAAQDLVDPSRPLDLAAAAAGIVQESDLADSGIDGESLARRAVALVEEIRGSAVWRRLPANASEHVEVPFSIVVPAEEIPPGVGVDRGPIAAAMQAALPVLIRGQIDLVFLDASSPPPPGMTGWVVVDWKTTSVTDADAGKLEAHYRPQLRLYARCWAAGLADGPDAG